MAIGYILRHITAHIGPVVTLGQPIKGFFLSRVSKVVEKSYYYGSERFWDNWPRLFSVGDVAP